MDISDMALGKGPKICLTELFTNSRNSYIIYIITHH
jgi:hypothetical protein